MSSLHDVGLDDDDPELDPVGLVVEIAYRPEAGLVEFRVGDGRPVILSGFGAPLRLRPWVHVLYPGDRVKFEQPYIEYDAEYEKPVAS